VPYFNSPIMLPAVASYLRSPAHLAAEIAPQLLKLVDLRRQRRLARDPHDHAGRLLVDRALIALRTRVASLQRRVRHLDPNGSLIGIGAVAPVTACRRWLARSARLGWIRPIAARLRRSDAGIDRGA
jgi:hypothetical protein